MAKRDLQWCRLHADFYHDPKIQSLSFDDQRHFIVLLCLKTAGVLDDEYPSVDVRRGVIARAMGLDRAALDEVQRRLGEWGFVDEQLQPANWDKRQYRSDSSAERVRRHRQRKNSPETGCNVTVTPSETETETEEIDTSQVSERLQAGASAGSRPFVTRSGQEWQVPRAKLREWTEFYTRLNVPREIERARLWTEANGARNRKDAYGRFLVNWLNRADSDLPPEQQITRFNGRDF